MALKVAVVLALAGSLAAPSATVVSVVNRANDTVSLIDPSGGLPPVQLATGAGPHEALGCSGRIFVSNYGAAQSPGSSVSVYDAAARKPIATVSVAPLIRPHGMVCAGEFVWFTAKANMVVGRIRLSDLKMDQIVGTGQKVGHMIARPAAGDALFTANISAGVVTRILKGDVTTAAAGVQPEGLDVSPDGSQVWAANRGDNTISVIDTATMKTVATLPTAKFVFRVRFTPDGRRVFATEPESDAVRVYDVATRKLLQSIPVTGAPISIAIGPDGKQAYVTAAGSQKLVVLDLDTLTVAREFPTGPGPDGVAVL